MTVEAVVREWHLDEGWGVLDSPETPGGCWAHFSVVLVPGFAALVAGQHVKLEWEHANQDGYSFRAVRTWPTGTTPAERNPTRDDTTAYSSTLTIGLDDELD